MAADTKPKRRRPPHGLIPSRRCKGHNRQGNPCGKWAIRGGTVCWKHGGAARQVREAAQARVDEIIDANGLLRELRGMIYRDPGDAFDENGNLLPIKKWPDDLRKSLMSLKVVRRNLTSGDGQTDEVIEPRWNDKTKAVDLGLRHKGLLAPEKVEVSGAVNLVERLQAGRKRVADARRRG